MLGSSSSSSSAAAIVMTPPKYDVFLSFRGEDTRDNFTSHLYDGLCRKRIQTFIDYRLDKGDAISPELCKAMEESMIYIIIFSQHYASSSWCLDELDKILKCKKRYGRNVIPVFYKVDPSNVRHQEGCYKDAFVKHEKRFRDEVIQTWKDALTEAAAISGWDSNTTRPESMLVDGIVEDILRKLDRSFSSDDHRMVGIDKHIAQIQSLLQLEPEAVRIIGIWGMGGIGKTTLARTLHHKLATQFSSRSCVVNAQQEIEKDGIDCLHKKYLSELLEEDISSNGLHFAIERVKRAKVLLILDGVKTSSQIQELIGGHGNFGQGSRIIVTSRDMQVLRNAEADDIHEVKEMNPQDSLQLFSLYAFKQICPMEGYADLVEKVLEYAKGVPLALKVLGSLLYGRTRKAWESELQKLEKLPEIEIFNVLKLSYDGLDGEQKDIFLDIACLYVGDFVNDVVDMLNGCGFSADIGMHVLKDKSLISTLRDRIVVHDLIVEMGKQIVRQECVNHPGKRSRLWDHEEIYDVLRNNQGTDAVQCIFLAMWRIKKLEVHPKSFKSMPNLRMLCFHNYFPGRRQTNVILPACVESLSNSLKLLDWDEFPQRSLPLDFCPKNLVELLMQYSDLEQLWEDDQELPNLKRLDLRASLNLIRIPDLSKFPNIEEIILSGCESLIQVYSSSFLCKLKLLYLNGCLELTSLDLSSNALSRTSGLVGLYNCCKLETFSINRTEVVQSRGCSQIYDDVKFRWTYLEGTSGYQDMNGRDLGEKSCIEIEDLRENLPSQLSQELCWLDLGKCKLFTSLPIDLCKLKLLRRLYLSGCSNLNKIPEIEETLENLAVLVLDETAIQELPSSLHRLVGLEELSLRSCRRLEIIPSSIGRLTKLCKLDLAYCESLETFPRSIYKLKLTKLNLFGCSKLKNFPEILNPAESFAHIDLSWTVVKELPSSLDCLVGLQTLCLNWCCGLESLPNSIGNLSLLSVLDCSACRKLTEIPNDIGRLSSLRELSLRGTGIVYLPENLAHLLCLESLDVSDTRIVSLPESIAHLTSLKSLNVSECRQLDCIPQLPPFLNQLLALKCPSIRRMIGEDAYRFEFFCFPGSAVPNWFPYRCEGNSITVGKDSLDWCNDDRLIGFSMCVVLRFEKKNYTKDSIRDFRCRLTFESDGQIYIIPNNNKLNDYFSFCCYRMGHVEHTFLWKHYLMVSASIDRGTFHADNFTFDFEGKNQQSFKLYPEVKECGICPLYSKEKDDFEERCEKRQCLR
ncbi:disease resistance protein RPV1-like isoform X2 [Lotus japonicus]|nr:disease resistance protein RPV1-like isoform X2 [Lotus japonicus]XP_057419975.1 disease resistance protein RPV1-like isoform X2 [Lotus japonicus]XP_057419982.1 disease resistance protein RPV1-like isoform X2 [Lotus japonicus]XP_057419989.1 disease resistance protein RPV1-like isoform X2 [Lotus japonicus]XP_057419996.1 disease resistance protein RPV1-like isoform X2 [Lotus japonicus]